jgi:folate-binding protein YgfZ
MTEEYNPLEAGLYHAVSLSKGCYIGQETLAKVHTKGALRRQLWGLELDAPCAVGDEVQPPPRAKPLPTLAEALEKAAAAASSGEEPAPSAPAAEQHAGAARRGLGVVTSCVDLPQGGGHRALAYLRCKVEGKAVDLEGAKVEVGGVAARVVALPFAVRTFAAGAGGAAGAADEEEAQRLKEAEEAAEAERRAEKLRAMQERLAAWQATQGGGS